MRIAWLPAAALFAATLVATPAHAETDRSMAFDLRFGGYFPSIDSEFSSSSATPFQDTFGGSDRLLLQIGLEKLLFQKFGLIGVGGSLGYAEFYGHGFTVASDGTTERSVDSTAFKVLPIYAYASYRFDYAAQKWGVPVMPYGKIGLGTHIYWTTNGLGDTSGGGAGSGSRLGLMGALGLGLHLDAFDPRLAREFDADWGVNDSYFVVEYLVFKADGLGTSSGFDLSDSGVLCFGLALAF